MIKKYVQKEIDKVIKTIWLNEMCQEYGKGHFLLERSIQCSFYHHLRSKLDPLLEEHSLFIYPELYIKDLVYYADLAIVEMDMEDQSHYLHDRKTDIAAIIEIKYGGTLEYIRSDIPKLKEYVQFFREDYAKCHYYFAFIDEKNEHNYLNLLDKRGTNNWANGCFTELGAGYIDETMYFEVNSYNNINFQYRQSECEFYW